MAVPKEHRVKIHSTNPLERVDGEVKRRTQVVGIFPNEAAITRLVGAILSGAERRVWSALALQGVFGSAGEAPALAVVYPALERGTTAAGLDGLRGSTARQMDELGARIVLGLESIPV